jgi:hypothetical protein
MLERFTSLYLKLVLSVTYRGFIDNFKFVLFFLLTIIYIYKLITLVTLVNRPLFISCLVLHFIADLTQKKTLERFSSLLHWFCLYPRDFHRQL